MENVNLLYFIFVSHFFQSFISILLLMLLFARYFMRSTLVTYPELALDALTLTKILKYPFRKKIGSTNENIDSLKEKAERIHDQLNLKIDSFFDRTINPFIAFFFGSTISGWALIFIPYTNGTVVYGSFSLNLITIFLGYTYLVVLKKTRASRAKNDH